MGHLFKSMSAVQTIVCKENEVVGSTEEARFKVSVYRPDIFRIHITKEENFRNFSYAVIQEPEIAKSAISEEAQSVTIETDSAHLVIDKNSFRINLTNLEGETLVSDDPGLGAGFNGDHAAVYKTLQEGERFIGLGEKTGNLDKRGEGFTNWNTDAFGYGESTDPIYSTIPFYIGIHSGRVYGVFLDNSYKSHFNFGASNHRFSSFTAEGGDINYYLFSGKTVAEIIEAYTWLTGRMEMPPKWGIGYQQCRYSYYPEHEMTTVAKTFRDKKIPCDVLYHDIHYMKDYKLFTWDKERFPNPKSMISELKEDGFHITVIIDPGVKIEEGYETYHDGLEKDVFVKFPDGGLYSADVWPGTCHFPDFTRPDVREWWGKKFEELVDQGVEGFWNDMNEIASWGNFMPNLMEFDYDGHKTSSKEARNVYGTQMARATKEGVEKLAENKRTFTITRAAYSGFQRYGILWTGDNVSTDEHMMLGCRMVSGVGLSGVAFTGNDIAGFAGRTEVALFARWLSIAVFQPFLRAHTFVNTADAEPWAFGEEVEEISRNYINLRYRLLPYVYTYFREATLSGLPISRSLALDYTHDQNIYDHRFQNQFLFGPSILVAPVESDKQITKVYLPEGNWYDLHSGEQHEGGQIIYADCPIERLPLFVKAGAILPMQPLVQYTDEQHDGTLTLHLYAGQSGDKFELYEDDGKSLDYRKGSSTSRLIEFNGSNELKISTPDGNYPSAFSKLEIVLHGYEDVSGAEKVVDFSYFEPISQFDAFAEGGRVERSKVFVLNKSLDSSEQIVSW